jgi:hypothetical protein
MKTLEYASLASPIVTVKITDPTSATNGGKTGLTNSTSGLNISIRPDNSTTATTYTGGSTIQTIATLGTYAAPSASNCRFKEIDATNQPGHYEMQFATSLWATSGARKLTGSITCGTVAAQTDFEIQLAQNLDVGAAAGVTGSPIPFGTSTGQLNTDSTGAAPISYSAALPTAPTANTVGEALFFADIIGGRVGTAQSGGLTSIQLDAGASSAPNSYVGDQIFLYGGTGGGIRGVGQRRTIVAYNTSNKTATVDRAWETNPDSTTKFATIPQPVANTGMWAYALVTTPNIAGVPVVDLNALNGNTTGVINFLATCLGLFLGTVSADGTASTTSFTSNTSTSPGLSTTTGFYSTPQQRIVFYSGANLGKCVRIASSGYTYSTFGTFTLMDALPVAPSTSDKYFIIAETP